MSAPKEVPRTSFGTSTLGLCARSRADVGTETDPLEALFQGTDCADGSVRPATEDRGTSPVDFDVFLAFPGLVDIPTQTTPASLEAGH